MKENPTNSERNADTPYFSRQGFHPMPQTLTKSPEVDKGRQDGDDQQGPEEDLGLRDKEVGSLACHVQGTQRSSSC